MVLAVDVERERISLGIKQLDTDPFTTFLALNDKGAVVNGTVQEVDAKGAVIALGDGIDGYLRASEISRDRVEDARNVLKEGDSVEAMIINVDRKNRTISCRSRPRTTKKRRRPLRPIPAIPAWVRPRLANC